MAQREWNGKQLNIDDGRSPAGDNCFKCCTNPSPGETQVLMEPDPENITRKERRQRRKNLQTDLETGFKTIVEILPPTDESLEQLTKLLNDERLKELEDLVEQMKMWDVATTIPEPKSFLHHAHLQPVLAGMLNSIEQYYQYLELFIVRFNAENECIVPRSKSEQADKTNGPIHYAVTQLNGDFLEWLLARPGTDVNLRNSQKQTALMVLCVRYDKCMRDTKHQEPAHVREKIAELIVRLVQAGADFNICSSQLKLAFELLINHRASDEGARVLVDRCIELTPGAIAVQKCIDRNVRVVGFYNNNPNVRITEELLEIFLRFNDLENFAQHMIHFRITEDNAKKVIRFLLQTAFDQRLTECIRLIVKQGARYIFKVVEELRRVTRPTGGEPVTSGAPPRLAFQQSMELQKVSELEHRVELKGLLKKACLMGDVSILQLLLSNISDLLLLNEDPLLALTLTKAYDSKRRVEDRNALLACAELLASQYTIHISKTDNSGNTPLHLALKYGFESLAMTLLKRPYAFLGQRNRDNRTPLDYGRYAFWKSYLDHCIEVDEKRSALDRTVLRFNLNGFEPPQQNKAVDSGSTDRKAGWQVIQHANKGAVPPRRFAKTVTEMTTVRQIALSKELKGLLIHPVLYTFVMVKWTRLRHWNYLNLALTTLTVLCFGGYSLTACSVDGPNVWLKMFSVLGALFVGVRELLQMLILRNSYLSLANVFDVINVLAMGWVLAQGCERLVSSFVVISFTMELTFLFYSLNFNSLATMTHMFNTVSKNFLRSILLFLPLIVAFIYGFYLTYNQPQVGDTPPANCTDSECTAENFNNFRTFWDAAIKTLVMTTGELDASNIDFTDGKMLLFVVFLFFAPIVILNLINGLAVSDITAIREESELISIGKKVTMLERYERGAAKIRPAWLRRYFPKPFFAEHNCRIHVNTQEYRKVEVQRKEPPTKAATGSMQQVNAGGRTKKVTINTKPLSKCPWLPTGDWSDLIFNFRCFRLTLFIRLDTPILREALRIVENRQPIVTSVTPNTTPAIVEPSKVSPLTNISVRQNPAVPEARTKRHKDSIPRDEVQLELQELRAQLRTVLDILVRKERQQKRKDTKQIRVKGPKRKDAKRVRKSLRKFAGGDQADDE